MANNLPYNIQIEYFICMFINFVVPLRRLRTYCSKFTNTTKYKINTKY